MSADPPKASVSYKPYEWAAFDWDCKWTVDIFRKYDAIDSFLSDKAGGPFDEGGLEESLEYARFWRKTTQRHLEYLEKEEYDEDWQRRQMEMYLSKAANGGLKEAQLEFILRGSMADPEPEDSHSSYGSSDTEPSWLDRLDKLLDKLCNDDDAAALNARGILCCLGFDDLRELLQNAETNKTLKFKTPKDSVSLISRLDLCHWWAFYPMWIAHPGEDGAAAKGTSSEPVNYFRKSAKLGYVPAMRNLGICYEYGFCVKVDFASAKKWYQKAADQGDEEAKARVAKLDSNDHTAPSEFEAHLDAMQWGSLESMWIVAHCYAEGDGVEQNYAKAIEILEILATKNNPNPNALYELGLRYAGGIGVEKDSEKSRDYFDQAKEHDYGGSKYSYGEKFAPYDDLNRLGTGFVEWFNQNGWEVTPEEHEDASETPDSEKDALQNLNMGLCYATGLHDEPQDSRKAFQYFMKSAEGGNSLAQYLMGIFYDHGWGVARNDGEMIRWCVKAANNGRGSTYAILGLGCFWLGDPAEYFREGGKLRDPALAEEYFSKLLDEDHVDDLTPMGKAGVQGKLALCYVAQGKKDKNEEIFRLSEEAAKQDHPLGIRILAQCYAEGIGTQENKSKTQELFERLDKLAQNDKEAMKYMPALYALSKIMKMMENARNGGSDSE